MLIEKQFSSYDDYSYEDERVYSVLMNEDELRLYSEFLEEREYAEKRKEEKKMKTIDKISLWEYNHLYGKKKEKKTKDIELIREWMTMMKKAKKEMKNQENMF